MEKYIDIYADYVIRNPDEEDETVLEYLLKNNVPEQYAIDIITFTPTAFNRMYFKDSQVHFSDFYIVQIENEYQNFKFSENKIFIASQNYYQNHFMNTANKNEIINIVGRCSEFGVIMQALHDNSDLRNLSIDPMLLLY